MTEAELLARCAELIPGTFAEHVLADPLNKNLAREFDVRIAIRDVLEHFVRAWGGKEIAPFHADRLGRALQVHAKIVGNLGERTVTIPANVVEAFLKDMKEESARKAVDLIDAAPRLVKAAQKAIGDGKA